jgi:hypothetical protein
MVDELAVTNEIWRRWNETKIIPPPMTWAELRKKVEEYVKAGKDPYDILRGPAPSKEWMEKKGFVEANKLSCWPNPEPDAIVEEKELITFAEWLLAAVKRVWETKKAETEAVWIIEPTDKGVLVGVRGASRPHEFFPLELIQKIETHLLIPAAIFHLDTVEELSTVREILRKYGISFREVGRGLEIHIDPDYALEVLASEDFDTSRILVERS